MSNAWRILFLIFCFAKETELVDGFSFRALHSHVRARVRVRANPDNYNYKSIRAGLHQLHAKNIPEDADNVEPASSFNTALCVVPPQEVWDTIQRARHLARDTTYRRWPPAIRLFHPFCPRTQIEDAALSVASIVEKYNIEPFQIKLNTLAVVPHLEAIEADLEAFRSLPVQQSTDKGDTRTEKEKEVEAMIEIEAQVGIERLKRRKRRTSRQKETPAESEQAQKKLSPRKRLENQKQMYDEFNGPCIVCLEPDRRSREKLEQIRDVLVDELFPQYDRFSASSSIAITGSLPKSIQRGESTFRPLLPVGAFSSVSSAISFAKRLKALWRPLSFKVSDLQFISDLCVGDSNDSTVPRDRDDFLAKMSVNDPTGEENFEIADQFGCDAAVMLVGEEIEQDDETNELMVDMILREGIPGAGDTTQAGSEEAQVMWDADDSPEDDIGEEGAALLAWLDDDEDEEEGAGTAVVLGRTHLFSGEMRNYDG